MNDWRFRGGSNDSTAVLEVTVGGAIPKTSNAIRQAPAGRGLPAPDLVSPSENAVLEDYPRTTALTWAAVAAAKLYIVECEYKDGDSWVHALGGAKAITGQTQLTFHFVGAQPGRWRVASVGQLNRAGTPTEWREFRYAR